MCINPTINSKVRCSIRVVDSLVHKRKIRVQSMLTNIQKWTQAAPRARRKQPSTPTSCSSQQRGEKNPTMNIILLPANISGGQLAVTPLPSDKHHQHQQLEEQRRGKCSTSEKALDTRRRFLLQLLTIILLMRYMFLIWKI